MTILDNLVKRYKETVRGRLQKYTKENTEDYGLLGNNAGQVRIRDHWVHVRLNNGVLVRAWNQKVPNRYNLQVKLEFRKGRWYVVDARDSYDDPIFTGTTEHAETHDRYGYDVDWVKETRIIPGLVTAIGGMSVRVYSVPMHTSTGHADVTYQDVDLTAYIPTSGANWLLIEEDVDGALVYTAGATVDGRTFLLDSNIPNPVTSGKMLAAVKMYPGQTSVVQSAYMDDIRDLRWGKDSAPIFESATIGNVKIPGAFDIMKDPTGFVDPDAITSTYDSATRTITLTGDLRYTWRGVLYDLGSPWTSSAHDSAYGNYYLSSSDGINFTWSTSVWTFDLVMVAKVNNQAGYIFGTREHHGMMPWLVHREFHSVISTYRISGGGLTAGTYAENTATDAATTPGLDAFSMRDEDISHPISAWLQGTYTTMRIGASNVVTFDTTATFPFRSSGSYILVNDPSTGSETAGANNNYVNIYAIHIPTTGDTDSQKYRVVWLQPQRVFASLADAQAEAPSTLSLGDLGSAAEEYIFYERITYILASGDANTGKCRIATGGISYISGTRLEQLSLPAGGGGSGSGDVVGPVGATDNAIVRYDGTTGKLIQNSSATIDDSGTINIPTGQTYNINGSPHTHTNAREVLTANRTYYVRTDGSDSNDGLTNTSGGAFLTIAKALSTVGALDFNLKSVTIQLGDGTYTAGGTIPSLIGGGVLYIQGNTLTPANVLVSVTGGNCFYTDGTLIPSVVIKDMELRTTTSGSQIYNAGYGTITIQNMRFGACADYQLFSKGPAAFIRNYASNYTISGGAKSHVIAIDGAFIQISNIAILTLSGTPAFSTAFAYADRLGGIEIYSNTYSGSATGKYFDVRMNSIIYVAGAGLTALPGSTPGTTATGGQYA